MRNLFKFGIGWFLLLSMTVAVVAYAEEFFPPQGDGKGVIGGRSDEAWRLGIFDGITLAGGNALYSELSSTTSAADSLAIPITAAYVAKTTGADAEALTLANGTAGQVLTIALVTDGGGDGTLTPATVSGFATVVLADAGDNVTLKYIDDTVGWVIIGAAGVAAPPVITI